MLRGIDNKLFSSAPGRRRKGCSASPPRAQVFLQEKVLIYIELWDSSMDNFHTIGYLSTLLHLSLRTSRPYSYLQCIHSSLANLFSPGFGPICLHLIGIHVVSIILRQSRFSHCFGPLLLFFHNEPIVRFHFHDHIIASLRALSHPVLRRNKLSSGNVFVSPP
jgi:hypothetical protein